MGNNKMGDNLALAKAIDRYFKKNSQRDILKHLYDDDIKVYKSFDPTIWEEVIDKQMDLDSENLAYCGDDTPQAKYKNIFDVFRGTLEEEFPLTPVENTMFPTLFRVLEHNGKRIIISMMIGQGCVMDTSTEEGFAEWMKNNGGTYKIDKVFTLEDFKKAVDNTRTKLEAMIENADTKKEA